MDASQPRQEKAAGTTKKTSIFRHTPSRRRVKKNGSAPNDAWRLLEDITARLSVFVFISRFSRYYGIEPESRQQPQI
jgi:hypothetical protein